MLRSRAPLSLSSTLIASLASLALGCGPEPSPVTALASPSTSGAPAVTTAASSAEAAASGAPAAKTAEFTPIKPPSIAFENPGGMWTPAQMKGHEATLKQLGVEMNPAALSDPTSFPLNAVISLGGCTASFVSNDGLVITNHHCAQRALQLNSTPKENLLQDGFLAKSRADERWNGPTARVFVTRGIRDVTSEVRAGIESIKNDSDRYKKMEAQTKQLIAACEKGRPEIRCSVSAFFGGSQQMLIEQLEIRDVRLVYAPPEGVGNFGGEIDNWRWPRHDGDFAIFRAYVGKDGAPADHAAENVPYHPPSYLKIAKQPLAPGDFVMVAGYPANTNRLRLGSEVESMVSWQYPRTIKMFEEAIGALEQLSRGNEERAIKAEPMVRGLNNALTNYRGVVDGLVKGGLAAQRAKKDAELRAWIQGDAGRKAKYGAALDKMEALLAQRKKTREQDAALGESMRFTKLLYVASMIVRMAEERPKKDADRDPELQERNWKRFEQELATLQKTYDRALDAGMMKLLMQRIARLPAAERSPILSAVVGKGEPTVDAIGKAVDALFSGTKLEDEAERLKLFTTAKTEDLKKSSDPMIKLALSLRPAQKDLEKRVDAFVGAMALLTPHYIEALRTSSSADLAPDANSTLRITYGTVRGYRPEPSAKEAAPFTSLAEMVKKHTGKEPFDAPARVLEAAKARRFGPYADAKLGDVPVDFLSDLDITGGNSGSPTLNARGELVGLAFDGNYESIASDWLFMPEVTRTIHVDVRYILWLLDMVEGADALVKELGVTPTAKK